MTRALDLCRQMGETPQLFPVLVGLWRFYMARGGALQTAHALGESPLHLARRIQDSAVLVEGNFVGHRKLC